MRIPTFFLTILFLLCTQFVSATDTTIGTSTTGTSTVGTQTVEPISISPLSGVAIAGVPLQFVALNKDGKKIDALFSASDGIITDTGIFTLPKAGRAMITARQGEVSAVAMVTVLPAAPHHIVVDAPDTFIYGDKYLSDGLASYQILDQYNNEIIPDQSLVKTTIKKNTMGNMLGRLVNAGGSGLSAQYTAMLRPVLIGGYISEAGQVLFFERGTYTITVKYGDIMGTKEFTVIFREPYQNVVAWADYHMGNVSIDNKTVEIQYDILGQGFCVIPLQGDVYTMFDAPGLMCKFFAICKGHYRILEYRQELIEKDKLKTIHKIFIGLIQPQGAK